jgi:hypothetical protein
MAGLSLHDYSVEEDLQKFSRLVAAESYLSGV